MPITILIARHDFCRVSCILDDLFAFVATLAICCGVSFGRCVFYFAAEVSFGRAPSFFALLQRFPLVGAHVACACFFSTCSGFGLVQFQTCCVFLQSFPLVGSRGDRKLVADLFAVHIHVCKLFDNNFGRDVDATFECWLCHGCCSNSLIYKTAPCNMCLLLFLFWVAHEH